MSRFFVEPEREKPSATNNPTGRRPPMKKTLMKKFTFLAIAGLAGGCSSAAVIKEAQTKLNEAQQIKASAFAPYEYAAAKKYLEFAVEEVDDFDHKSASNFAAVSIDFSKQAIEKAKAGGAK